MKADLFTRIFLSKLRRRNARERVERQKLRLKLRLNDESRIERGELHRMPGMWVSDDVLSKLKKRR